MITPREQTEVDRANQSGRPPIVFVHGLWMLASSWQPWTAMFTDLGYATVAVDWPDDPDTVQQGRSDARRFARKRILDMTDHVADVVGALTMRPATVGHSFGGLIVQQIAGRGLSASTVAIDAAPFRGVFPLPVSSLRSAFPVLRNPLNYQRSVALNQRQFRYAFTNALDQLESDQLFAELPVPGSGRPLFQAATANINPSLRRKWTPPTPSGGRYC